MESGLFIATRSYDTAGRLTGVSNGSLDSTAYTLSADGRRTGIARNGLAEAYGYDGARQVTSANYGGLSTTQSWNYDPAGNRSSAITNGATTTYLANTVNEYTSITGSPAPPMYDANGNAISYPVKPLGSGVLVSCVFSWDINNQQISATVGSDSATYQYDALGRRTKRSETLGGVTTNTWFLTNGWNVELEHNGSNYTTRQTWGLDLSNTLQGAGGVGGLVMVEELPTSGAAPVPSFPTYDGNGNITTWVNASGTVTARQRYDAFGNIVEQTGTTPSNYGFSTKPMEKVTGLHYYGYRHYDPLTGRWPSRDPIGERGGINLYAFVGNNGVNSWDYLGMAGGAARLGCCGDTQLTSNADRCCDGKKIYRPGGSGPRGAFDPTGPCCLGLGDGTLGRTIQKVNSDTYKGDWLACMKGEGAILDGITGSGIVAILNQLGQGTPVGRWATGALAALLGPATRCSDYICVKKY